MREAAYPTRLGLPAPTPPPATLHLINGVWLASCPTCGYQLAGSRSQQRAERLGRRRRCPVCPRQAA
jgi:cytochrome c-type biogenesis protein CcmH/NrfF